MKNCVLGSLFILITAASLFAEPASPVTTCDSVFWWLAAGVSSARIQRLVQVPGSTQQINCRASSACGRALQKAGADTALIDALSHLSPKSLVAKTSVDASRASSTTAAQVAILIHQKKFDVAEEKLRALLNAKANAKATDSVTSDQDLAIIHFALGTLLRRQERFDEALDELTESSRLKPGSPETHNELSYVFYKSDDSDAALAEARTALSMDPANAAAYRALGLAFYANGHYDAAIHAFNEALTREPEGSLANADVYFDIGLAQRDQGDLRRAGIAYRHALSIRPDFWEAHSNLGVVLHDQGKLDEAIAEYRTAKRLNPTEASVRNNLGNTLCDKEDFGSAIAEFKDLFHQNPEWDGGRNCLARAYMSKRDYPSAVKQLKAAIVANPTGAAEYRVLGQALLLQGKDQEALDALRHAVSLNPDSGLGHHYLGTAFVNTHQMAEAETEFREALRLEPSAQNHYSLAACLMALNRYEDALGEFEIASRMDPNENLYRARMEEVVRLIGSDK